MRAYYFDNLPGDHRLPHDYDLSRPVSAEALAKLGIQSWFISVDGHESKIDAIAHEQGYKNRDLIDCSRSGLGTAFEEKTKVFFQEHIHEDDEVRYVLSGSGFFDIRETPSNDWIRLAVSPGDLLVLPAGIYHRFSLDIADNIKIVRLFKDEPKWISYNRSAETDANPHRIRYLQNIGISVGA